MTLSYDPLQVLMEEHQVFLARVESFREAWRQTTKLSPASPALAGEAAQFAVFLARDVDEFHAAKEERALFPVLERRRSAEESSLGHMRDDHESLRALQRSMGKMSSQLDADPGAPEPIRRIARIAESIETLLSQHVIKEDFVLFPMAQDVLSRRDMLEVARRCQGIEQAYRERYGVNPGLLLTAPEALHSPLAAPL